MNILSILDFGMRHVKFREETDIVNTACCSLIITTVFY